MKWFEKKSSNFEHLKFIPLDRSYSMQPSADTDFDASEILRLFVSSDKYEYPRWRPKQ